MHGLKKWKAVVLVSLVAILLCGCEASEGVYKTLSDSFEVNDDELQALTEGKLDFNDADENGSDLDINVEPGDIGGSISNIGNSAKSGLYKAVSGICTWSKSYGYIIAVASAFIGIIIMRLARKSINIRRKALLIFVLGIPIIVIVLMYGTAFLADSMLN